MLPKEFQLTYSNYKDFPEDGKRYEILEGRLLMVPSPFTPHQRISGKLYRHLSNYVEKNNLGEVFHPPYDVVLSELNVVQPDIIYVSKENSNIITEENIKGVPDLVIEIVSKTSRKNDETTKKMIYARSNIKEYWIVYPESKTINVFTKPEQGYVLWKEFLTTDTLSTPTFPDIKLDIAKIFF